MWLSAIGIGLVMIGIGFTLYGTYQSLWSIINVDLKKVGTWGWLAEQGKQAKEEKSKASHALRYIVIGSIAQIIGSVLQIIGMFIQ